jgi:hypothetical protein
MNKSRASANLNPIIASPDQHVLLAMMMPSKALLHPHLFQLLRHLQGSLQLLRLLQESF